MAKVNHLISKRLKTKQDSPKMTALAELSANGHLTSFSGVFSISELNQAEKTHLRELLKEYSTANNSLSSDLKSLESITSEIKAINNQAALLHGERIKRAQNLFKYYREGAFTAWLIATYGNRQTPYNFLHYHEFWNQLPQNLRKKVETMPRQAIYTLASRNGEKKKKEQIINDYAGETKAALISLIRKYFPLAETDKRRAQTSEQLIKHLCQIHKNLKAKPVKISAKQKQTILKLLDDIYSSIH